MWIFPFKNIILKTNLTRQEVADAIEQNTFLSDAGYKRKDELKKFFYGTVSTQEFDLETIDPKAELAGFFEGSIKGVERDIYIFLSIRGFKFRRVFVLLYLFTLSCIGIIASDVAKKGLVAFYQTGTLLFIMITLLLWGYLLFAGYIFGQKARHSIDFFRGMLQADQVQRDAVPIIFRQ